MCMGTPTQLFYFFYNEKQTICVSSWLLPLATKKKLLNLGVLLKEKFAPRGANSRADLIKKGGKNQSDRVASPESVSACVIQ